MYESVNSSGTGLRKEKSEPDLISSIFYRPGAVAPRFPHGCFDKKEFNTDGLSRLVGLTDHIDQKRNHARNDGAEQGVKRRKNKAVARQMQENVGSELESSDANGTVLRGVTRQSGQQALPMSGQIQG